MKMLRVIHEAQTTCEAKWRSIPWIRVEGTASSLIVEIY